MFSNNFFCKGRVGGFLFSEFTLEISSALLQSVKKILMVQGMRSVEKDLSITSNLVPPAESISGIPFILNASAGNAG